MIAQGAVLEEALHQRLVGFGDGLDEGGACRLRLADQGLGNRALDRRPAVDRGGERLHADDVDDAGAGFALADGQMDRHHAAVAGAAQRHDGPLERGAIAVEAAEGDQPRQPQFLGGGPRLLGLHRRTRHRVDDDDDGIGDAQRRARVGEEIGDAGGVEEVDLGLAPLGVGERGAQGVLAGNLLGVVVGHGRAVVDAAQPVDHAGGEQHRRHQLRLATASVPDDGDIPDAGGVIHLHSRILRATEAVPSQSRAAQRSRYESRFCVEYAFAPGSQAARDAGPPTVTRSAGPQSDRGARRARPAACRRRCRPRPRSPGRGRTTTTAARSGSRRRC